MPKTVLKGNAVLPSKHHFIKTYKAAVKLTYAVAWLVEALCYKKVAGSIPAEVIGFFKFM
jgi:hypothetical protein